MSARSIATEFPLSYPVWRRVFAFAVFPAVFGAGIAAAYVLVRDGNDPKLAAAAISVLAGVCVIVAERIQPHAEAWSRSHGDAATDAAHLALSQVLPPQLVDLVLPFALLPVATMLAAQTSASLWPSGWGFLPQLLLTMAVSEFGYYWWHRLCHSHSWFWRFHATHHSAPRLYWLNAGRFHPLDTVVAYTMNVSPLILLGAPTEMLAMFTVWTAIHGLFQHSNIELRLGPLNYVFSMAELHRWHHSRVLADQNNNYGGNVILWDLMFGTFHFPKDRRHAPQDVGFEGDVRFPRTYAGQLASVFTWEERGRDARSGDG